MSNNEEIRKLADQLYELAIFCFNVDYKRWCELMDYDPENDYSREKWDLFQRKPLNFICEQTQKRRVIAEFLNRTSGSSSSDATDHERLLGEALHKVLIKAGVLNEDSTPSGPALILAAEEYADSK